VVTSHLLPLTNGCLPVIHCGCNMAPQQRQSVPAPDSPRSSQSPPPSGVQGDLELELLGLANALYNLGTTVINDSTKERDKPGGGKQVGLRV
jgi:mediator of RNA polymerase II transcription subunit 10